MRALSETGVAGLALSGGVSNQRRRDGMTVDNLIAYTRDFWDAAAPFSNGQTYFNFPGLFEEGRRRRPRQLRRQPRPPRAREGRLRPRERLPAGPEHIRPSA